MQIYNLTGLVFLRQAKVVILCILDDTQLLLMYIVRPVLFAPKVVLPATTV